MTDDRTGTRGEGLSRTHIESDIERRVNTKRDIEELRADLDDEKHDRERDVDELRERLSLVFNATKEAQEAALRYKWLLGAVVAVVGGIASVAGLIRLFGRGGP